MDKKVYEFISEKYWEKIVEWKKCKICNETFPIYEWDIKMLEKISPTIWGEKFILPVPDECPDCRQIQRLIFRNENTLYKAKSAVSWKPLISIFSEEMWLNIYSFQEFYSDADFSTNIETNIENFDENLRKMYYKLPQLALQNWPNMENSEYNNLSGNLKNCYLCYDCWWIEDSLYCWFLWSGTNNVVDCFDWAKLQHSYSLIGSAVMNKSQYCTNSDSMSDCYFCNWSSNLSYCIGCNNIKNKEYQIFNRPVTKEVFNAFKNKHFNWTHSWIESFMEIYKRYNQDNEKTPNNMNYQSENVVGWYMVNAVNIFFGRFTYRSKDSRYSYFCDNITDCSDVDFCVNNMQLSYNCITCFNSYNIISCINVSDSNSCYYCTSCSSCKNCIWCYWLSHSEYYIFNKRYSQEEYEKLVKQIIKKLANAGKWGNFISSNLSLFPYNDTVAFNIYPPKNIIRFDWINNIVNKNWKWTIIIKEGENFSKAILDLWGEQKLNILYRTNEQKINIPAWLKTIKAKDLPDNIKDVGDDILDIGIICEESWRIFRITKMELEFYKKHLVPIPKKHSQLRQIENFQKRPSGYLYIRKCGDCGIEMLTIYSEEKKPRLYCEECFDKEIL